MRSASTWWRVEVTGEARTQRPHIAWRGLLAILPSIALAALVAGLVAMIAPHLLLPALLLVGLYFVTPVAKETWIAIAPWKMGIPATLAFVVLLTFEACIVLLVVRAAPVEAVLDRFKRARRFRQKVAASKWGSRSLALALTLALCLPFHSGGGIVGSATGRSLGLSRTTTFCSVLAAATWRLGVALLVTLAFL